MTLFLLVSLALSGPARGQPESSVELTSPRVKVLATLAGSVSTVAYGKGTVIAQEGNKATVLTAAHVVREVSQVFVLGPTGERHEAKIVHRDTGRDLAIIMFTSPQKYRPSPIAATYAVKGSKVTSVRHSGETLTNTVSGYAGEDMLCAIYSGHRSGDSGSGVFQGGKLVGVHYGTDKRYLLSSAVPCIRRFIRSCPRGVCPLPRSSALGRWSPVRSKRGGRPVPAPFIPRHKPPVPEPPVAQRGPRGISGRTGSAGPQGIPGTSPEVDYDRIERIIDKIVLKRLAGLSGESTITVVPQPQE